MAKDDTKRDPCATGELEKSCSKFIKPSVISQYEQTINSETLGTNNEGNLTELLNVFRPNKLELFSAVCDLYHSCDIEDIEGWKLDCLGAMLGLTRNLCDLGTLDDEAYRKVVKNRIFELGNPFATLGEVDEHIKDIFGEGSYDLCVSDGCINIFMKREFTADEQKYIQAYLDSLPIPLNQCVKLYPSDITKCLYLQYDDDVLQGGINEALMNCGEQVEVYTRSSRVTGDESQDIRKCLWLNAPYNGGMNGFYTDKGGLNGWNLNCYQKTIEENEIKECLYLNGTELCHDGLNKGSINCSC